MDRRIKKTNSAIFNAYIQAKKNNPDTEPSVKEICAMADINKTTFYRYFTDVESLCYSLIATAVDKLLVNGIEVEKLFTEPEVYFKQVLMRFNNYESELSAIFIGNPHTFIFEAERILRAKLKETTGDKYDEVLVTFIAGGAVHYFLSANYDDEAKLNKFCRIIRAATSAV